MRCAPGLKTKQLYLPQTKNNQLHTHRVCVLSCTDTLKRHRTVSQTLSKGIKDFKAFSIPAHLEAGNRSTAYNLFSQCNSVRNSQTWIKRNVKKKGLLNRVVNDVKLLTIVRIDSKQNLPYLQT